MANEKKVQVNFPLPTSPAKQGFEVQVKESTERWTEATLEDGTVIRLKAALVRALRIEDEYDAEGNPAYSLMVTPQIVIVSSPDHLRRPSKTGIVQ